MTVLDEVASTVESVLQSGKIAPGVSPQTALLGSIPEFDSMSVVSIITALEEHFDITIEDDEVNGGIFETLGSLAAFVDSKLAE